MAILLKGSISRTNPNNLMKVKKISELFRMITQHTSSTPIIFATIFSTIMSMFLSLIFLAIFWKKLLRHRITGHIFGYISRILRISKNPSKSVEIYSRYRGNRRTDMIFFAAYRGIDRYSISGIKMLKF